MAYLFLVTIGPVQEFIAGARRTRDLWFGSWILSELSRTAALAVHAPEMGRRLVFPNPGADLSDRERGVVNRIIAEVTGGPEPAELGRDVEQALRARLSAIRDQAFGPQRISWDERFPQLRELAEKQVDELIEVFWVAATISGSYQKARARLEDFMSARKNTRLFPISACPPDLRLPKSSIDGIRESVIPEELYPKRTETREERARKAEQLYRRYRAGRAERLSGVDLLKRRGNRDGSDHADDLADFPSTSHFAALPFLRRIAQHAAFDQARDEYIRKLHELDLKPERLAPRYAHVSRFGGFDASILFEERLAEEADPATIAAAQAYLRAFYDRLKAGRPEPYYALLHADGDNMGTVIDNQPDAEAHRALSAALDHFAAGVRQTVEEVHSGALVYAGGDDVLAFLPLDSALACARQLASQFEIVLRNYKNAGGLSPTLSVGMVICHHVEPLADALNLARAAERAAKDLTNKNGLAITLSKRSGADRTIRGSWASDFVDRLDQLIRLHRAEAIPDGAAYDLRSLSDRLHQGGNRPDPGLLRAEAIRIVGRKRGLRGNAVEQNAELVQLAEALPSTEEEARVRNWDVTAFANELIVTREFARALGPA